MNLNGALVFSYRCFCQLAGSIGGFIDRNVGRTRRPASLRQQSLSRPHLDRNGRFMFGADVLGNIVLDMDGMRHLIKYAWIEKSITRTQRDHWVFEWRAPGQIIILIIFYRLCVDSRIPILRLVGFGEGTATT